MVWTGVPRRFGAYCSIVQLILLMPFSVDLKSNPNHRCSKYPENISQAGVIALLLPIAIPFNSI